MTLQPAGSGSHSRPHTRVCGILAVSRGGSAQEPPLATPCIRRSCFGRSAIQGVKWPSLSEMLQRAGVLRALPVTYALNVDRKSACRRFDSAPGHHAHRLPAVVASGQGTCGPLRVDYPRRSACSYLVAVMRLHFAKWNTEELDRLRVRVDRFDSSAFR